MEVPSSRGKYAEFCYGIASRVMEGMCDCRSGENHCCSGLRIRKPVTPRGGPDMSIVAPGKGGHGSTPHTPSGGPLELVLPMKEISFAGDEKPTRMRPGMGRSRSADTGMRYVTQ